MSDEYGPLCSVSPPILPFLDLKLSGVRTGRSTRPTSVVAYTDDMTIFVTSADEFAIITEAIDLHERT